MSYLIPYLPFPLPNFRTFGLPLFRSLQTSELSRFCTSALLCGLPDFGAERVTILYFRTRHPFVLIEKMLLRLILFLFCSAYSVFYSQQYNHKVVHLLYNAQLLLFPISHQHEMKERLISPEYMGQDYKEFLLFL